VSVQSSLSGSAKTGFTRTASGLVRNISLADAAGFGALATGGYYGLVYLYPWAAAFAPGMSMWVLIPVTFAVTTLAYFCYAALGSAMPRAGGDYLYQSRTIHRVVGFCIPWTCQVLFWLAFGTMGSYIMNQFGLVPMTQALGMDSVSSWLASGPGGFTVTAVAIALMWFLVVAGTRVYRKVQTFVLVPGLVIGGVTIIIVLLINWNTDFAHAFNQYFAGSITYQQVQQAAADNGYAPPTFNLVNTLMWVGVLVGGNFGYTMYAAQGLLGEVKDASNLRRLFFAFFIPGALVAFGMILLPWQLLQHVVGSEFLNQFAVAYANGAVDPGVQPNIGQFAQMLSPNAVVTVLISLGFLAGGFGIAVTVYMNVARVMMAMSLDGQLPKFLADVWNRTFTPAKAMTVWSVISLAVATWFYYDVRWQTAIILGGAVTSLLVVAVTTTGAGLFPFTARGIYESAPVARLRLGSAPVVTVLGLIAGACLFVTVYWALTQPAIGLTGRDVRIALIVAFASGPIFYILWGFWRRAKGIDVALTTREVPPE
jgi:basic amino acid/polyamine antiporter, APA family